MPKRNVLKLLVLALGMVGFACGNLHSPNPVSSAQETACSTGTAQLWIGDGFMKRLCGCAEAANTFFAIGSPMTCSVARGTKVFFLFIGTRNTHQIVPVGTPALQPSAIYSYSKKKNTPHSHVIIPDTVGNYGFADAFTGGMTGTLTVF